MIENIVSGQRMSRYPVGKERTFKGIQCEVTVGAWSYFQPTCEFRGYGTGDRIVIGKFCSIAQNVLFLVGGNHRFFASTATYPLHWLFDDTYPSDETVKQGDVIVGNDVWIGYGVSIVRAKIGHGCVIGAHSVVRGHIPPYSVVIGNPARIVRRFTNEQVEELLEICWWDWPTEKIHENMSMLTGDVRKFISVHSRR